MPEASSTQARTRRSFTVMSPATKFVIESMSMLKPAMLGGGELAMRTSTAPMQKPASSA